MGHKLIISTLSEEDLLLAIREIFTSEFQKLDISHHCEAKQQILEDVSRCNDKVIWVQVQIEEYHMQYAIAAAFQGYEKYFNQYSRDNNSQTPYIIKAPDKKADIDNSRDTSEPVIFSLKFNNHYYDQLPEFYKGLGLHHIDEDLTCEKTFISILTSKNISEEAKAIHFSCYKYLIKYILDQMKFMFNNFQIQLLENNAKFLDMHGKPLTHLSRSGTYAKKIDPKSFQNIDQIFTNLKLKANVKANEEKD